MALISGRNKRQERQAQDALVNRLASRYERTIAREVARAMREASRKFSKPMGLTDVRIKHADNMLKILTRLWTQAGKSTASATFSIAKSWLDMEVKLNPDVSITTPIVDGAIAEWIKMRGGSKITEITRTTMADINRIVSNGVRDGLAEREIGEMIEQVAPVKGASRAQTIARTEAHGSSMGIGLSIAGETNIPMRKVWITNESDRTREDHIDADGQERGLNEMFDVGGERLEYPGDPSGSPENVINCRCVIGYEIA